MARLPSDSDDDLSSDLPDDSDDIRGQDAEWDEWSDKDDSDDAAVSLFDATTLPSVAAALDYDAATHEFDLRQLIREVCERIPGVVGGHSCIRLWLA